MQTAAEIRSKTFAPDAFAGQVIFITGAGRGMGRVAAAKFAALGARIAITDLVEERIRTAADELAADGADVIGVAADVGKESDVKRAVDAAIARFGRIDVLVNAAGSYGAAHRATHETPVDEWDSVFASNVRGSFLCAKHVLPHMMQAKRGRIINFASNAARPSRSGHAAPTTGRSLPATTRAPSSSS